VQLIAEEILIIVVASLVVHCCAVKKNVIVASQLYDVADVPFTVEKEGSLEVLQFSQKYYLGNCSKYSNNHGCGVGSPVIRLRLLAISIIRFRLRTDSDLQLY